MKLICTYTFYAVAFLLLQGSNACHAPSILSAPNTSKVQNNLIQTRTVKHKRSVAAEAYYYRTLASCVKGATTALLPQTEQHPMCLVFLYDANAPWASVNHKDSLEQLGNEKLHAILDAYQLQITQQFAIDDKNKGWVLQSSTHLEDPIEIARLLSLVDYVLMVNVKEIPSLEIMVSYKK